MGRGPSKYFNSDLEIEIYEVLIKNNKASKPYPKERLLEELKDKDMALNVLKMCLDHDVKGDLKDFKKCLKLIVKNKGVSEVARIAKIHRVSLYRMLASGSNPELKSFLKLLSALELKFWVLGDDTENWTPKPKRARDYRKVSK
jgi:probable addiction module antidote protein